MKPTKAAPLPLLNEHSVQISMKANESASLTDDKEKILSILKAESPFQFTTFPKVQVFVDTKKRLLSIRCMVKEHNDASFWFLSNVVPFWVSSKPSYFSTRHFSFTLKGIDERLLFIEALALIESDEKMIKLQNDVNFFKEELLLALQSKHFTELTLAIRSLCHEKCDRELQHEFMQVSKLFQRKITKEMLDDVHAILLAIDQDFLKIRKVKNMLRLTLHHHVLMQKQRLLKTTKEMAKPSRICSSFFPTQLFFPFGKKNVVSFMITLNTLLPYEQFSERHIQIALKRLLPSFTVVPQSFFSLKNSQDGILSYYLELERKPSKTKSSLLTISERRLLKRELDKELSSAVEQVVSRIEIPENQDDTLRNILFLSQQIKHAKDIPQVIIQFQSQTEKSIEFHITAMRLLKKEYDGFPEFPQATPLVKFLPMKASHVGALKGKHPKQVLTFLLQCAKGPFLRRDLSIDFIRAREFVLENVEKALGKVRDLNGGLISQEGRLLSSIHPLLTREESKEIALLEALFLSLYPSVMKSLLGHDFFLVPFRQLLLFKENASKKTFRPLIVEESDKGLFIGCKKPEKMTHDEFLKMRTSLKLSEFELASSSAVCDGIEYFFLIAPSKDTKVRKSILDWIRSLLEKEVKKATTGKVLRLSLLRPTRLLDPRIGTDRTSGIVIKMLYEGLYRIGPSGKAEPALAQDIKITDDGRTYTFTLRDSFWSNGQKVTAYDFEYAWKKILDPKFVTIFDYLFHPIKNAKRIKKGEIPLEQLGVKAISPSTLRVELEAPAPYFHDLLSHWIYSPLCESVDEIHPGWAHYAGETYVCNGPFRLTKWQRKSEIQVVKNEWYWDKENVSIPCIDMSIIEDPEVALQLFEEGKLDWIGEPLSEIPHSLLKKKNPEINSHELAAVHWFSLHTEHPLFKSKKIRQAFSLALDRQAIIDEWLFGDEQASHSILPKSLSFLETKDPLPYNLEAAKKLFEEGVLEEGIQLSTLSPLTIMTYNQETQKALVKAARSAWEEAFGIQFIVEVVSWEEMHDKLHHHAYDILGLTFHSWYQHAFNTFDILKYKHNSINFPQWQNTEFLSLVNELENEQNEARRQELSKKLELFLIDEMVVVPVFDYKSHSMKNPALENVYVSWLGHIDFKWAKFV